MAVPTDARFILAGAIATFVGVGLQRFAYAPLLPAMVRDGWLDADRAGALAWVNFAGYLAGAVAAPRIAATLGLVWSLRAALAMAGLCFLLCAGPLGFVWLAPWRALAGIAGGVLMILAGPAVQASVAAGSRGIAGGAVFAGVGGGIVAGAVLVPLCLPLGLSAAWIALGLVTLSLCAATWTTWPSLAPLPPRMDPRPRFGRQGWRLVAVYALASMAATPHMAFWPDYIQRELGHGAGFAGLCWALYGVSAGIGTIACGRVIDRTGAPPVLRAVLGLQIVALLLPLLASGVAALLLSSVLAGLSAIGVTGIALARARELLGTRAGALWRVATIAWASAQVVTGFALAALYHATGVHWPLFAFGLAASVAASAADVLDREKKGGIAWRRRPSSDAPEAR